MNSHLTEFNDKIRRHVQIAIIMFQESLTKAESSLSVWKSSESDIWIKSWDKKQTSSSLLFSERDIKNSRAITEMEKEQDFFFAHFW